MAKGDADDAGDTDVKVKYESPDEYEKRKAEEKRQKDYRSLPKNTLVTFGLLGGLTVVLRKLNGVSTAVAVRDGAIAGGLVASTAAAGKTVGYLKDTEKDVPGYTKPIATAAQVALMGVGMLGGFVVAHGQGSRLLGRLGKVNAGGAVDLGKGPLAQFGKDLTAAAKAGELPRAFGVDDKVDELVAILGAKRKNNALLVGPAGTGKTALVEELAYRISSGEVPDHLKDVRLVQIDLDAMVAGTQYRGMFEERLNGVLKQIEAANGKIVPFIDETHKLVSAGAARNTEGAGEAVKPLLARGKIRLIGATTDAADEIGQIHADPALARRFTEISISEPGPQETLNILRSTAPRFEQQGMRFTDEALQEIVNLTQPITGRNQPDKAITMLDTTAARMGIAQDAKPRALKDLERQIATVSAEHSVVSRELSDASQDRTRELANILDELRPQADQLKTRWMAARSAREQLEEATTALSAATDEADIARLTERVRELQRAAQPHATEFPQMFATEITRVDVAATPLPAPAALQSSLRASAQQALRGVDTMVRGI